MKNLFILRVPLVVGAGNMACDPQHRDIETLPGILDDKDTPIINVGAMAPKGNSAYFSQGGPHLNIYAPSVEVRRADNKGRGGISSGTS